MSMPDGWQQASDPDIVHAFLEASDRAVAGEDAQVPTRSRDSSQRAVEHGWVWLLIAEGRPVAMITVSPEWTGGNVLYHFPDTPKPLYMRRLAVTPGLQGSGSLLSLRAIRKAVEVAREQDATALRCETNPAGEQAVRVLESAGFVRHGPELGDPPHSSVLYARRLL